METRLVLPLKLNTLMVSSGNHLTQAQLAITDWAKVDDYQAILDLDCGNPGLLQHYTERYKLRACGAVSNIMDEAQAREALGDSAEILRARPNDLPWKSASFHTIFLSGVQIDHGQLLPKLMEARRLLKPGGQLLLSFSGLPFLSKLFMNRTKRLPPSTRHSAFALMERMQQLGFSEVTMRSSRLQYTTITAFIEPAAHHAGL